MIVVLLPEKEYIPAFTPTRMTPANVAALTFTAFLLEAERFRQELCPDQTPAEAYEVMSEEWWEVVRERAFQSFDIGHPEDMQKELVDLLFTILMFWQAQEWDWYDLAKMLNQIREKNEAKTTDNTVLVDGKVEEADVPGRVSATG